MAARSRFHALTMILGVAGVVSLGAFRLAAQEPAKANAKADAKADDASKSAAAKKAIDPSRRVPPFFGQIGLSPEQKEEIYKVRGKHQEKIDSLEKQIAAVRGEMMAECESKLTDTQKQALESRRASADSKKAKASASAKPAEKGSD